LRDIRNICTTLFQINCLCMIFRTWRHSQMAMERNLAKENWTDSQKKFPNCEINTLQVKGWMPVSEALKLC
jgi:hypothetical protein